MPRAYAPELRRRVIDLIEGGRSGAEAPVMVEPTCQGTRSTSGRLHFGGALFGVPLGNTFACRYPLHQAFLRCSAFAREACDVGSVPLPQDDGGEDLLVMDL